jgi:hypothetical protein
LLLSRLFHELHNLHNLFRRSNRTLSSGLSTTMDLAFQGYSEVITCVSMKGEYYILKKE